MNLVYEHIKNNFQIEINMIILALIFQRKLKEEYTDQPDGQERLLSECFIILVNLHKNNVCSSQEKPRKNTEVGRMRTSHIFTDKIRLMQSELLFFLVSEHRNRNLGQQLFLESEF